MSEVRNPHRGARSRRGPRPGRSGREAGFTMIELLTGVSLFAGVAFFLLQGLLASMTFANNSDAKAAATSLGMQIMEQIRASANPYTMVGFTDLPRTSLPLAAPYNGIVNPTPHSFQVEVTVNPNDNLTLNTITVNVYRPQDPDTSPLASMTTVLDAQ